MYCKFGRSSDIKYSHFVISKLDQDISFFKNKNYNF